MQPYPIDRFIARHPLFFPNPIGFRGKRNPFWHCTARVAGPAAVVLYLLAFGLAAQSKRANQWYFGYGSAVDFNTTPPTVTSGFPHNQLEGTSSISDENGQLLFYTDGRSIWTRQHQVMPNGTDLRGDESSSQSALIVPKPGSSTLFYVFTAPAWGRAEGMYYSVVDMQLNKGMGDVVDGQKNVPLLVPATEKLAATLHGNGQDVWVVASQHNTNEYYAYLVTGEGVCDCPVVSAVGQIQSQYQGYLKFSPDGTRVASAQAVSDLELFTFDACTGRLAYSAAIPRWTDSSGGSSHWYGVGFSPDGSKLYASTGWFGVEGCAKLYQYDLNANDVVQSRAVLFDNVAPGGTGCGSNGVGAIQLGPDGKMYAVNWQDAYLHVIHNPNAGGLAANFVRNGLFLGNTSGGLGLPNFIESYFYPTPAVRTCAAPVITADFGHDDGCAGQPARFVDQSAADPPASLCYEWDFGDPGSGDDNSASIANPVHAFSAPGTYQVTLKVKSGTACKTATVRKPVTIRASPQVDLGRDTTLCRGGTLRLGTFLPGAAYHWQDGSTEPFFTAAAPGTYWVDIIRDNCTTRDSVRVDVTELVAVNLGNDTLLCAGATLSLNAARPGVSYRWQDGTTDPAYRVARAGMYWVELSNGICRVRDSIRVSYDVPRTVDLGADTTVCLGYPLKLTFPYPDLEFRWSNQSSEPELLIDREGTYWVTYRTPGTNCPQSDTLRVSFTECLDDLWIPNVFTPNGDGYNETFEVTGARGTTWSLALFNRWGKHVAGYEHYRNDWQAEGLENGIYYYVLTSRVSGRSFKGWVHVRR